MMRLVAVLAAALIASATAAPAQQTPPAPAPAPSAPAQQAIEPFAFVALGDMPYKVPQDFTKFERLIGVINTLKPAFSIHVGDIKSGSEPCTDEYMRGIFTRFQRFEQPLVFTPGDNEWTDCHRPAAGRYNPRERLAKVREVFFPNPTKSLGKVTLSVEPQSQVHAQHAKYVENTRFWKNGVLFVQVHVVGSNNGFETHDPEAAVEYFERNKANIAWLDDSYKLATDQGARALVISMQANLYDIRQKWPTVPLASGFLDTIRAVERGARQFQKPTLVIQGDEHEFEVDGFRGPDLKRVPNVWRLQLMGADYVHAVRVLVDPTSPGVFAFQPVIVWENGAY